MARASGCSDGRSAMAANCEQLRRVHTRTRHDSRHIRFAESECAGLVEHHGVDRAERFHVAPALDDCSALRRPANRAQDGQRRAGGDAAGAGDNDYGDRGAQIMR